MAWLADAGKGVLYTFLFSLAIFASMGAVSLFLYYIAASRL